MRAVAYTASAVAVALLAGSSAAQYEGGSKDFGSDGSGVGPEGDGTSMPPAPAPMPSTMAPMPMPATWPAWPTTGTGSSGYYYNYWRDSSSNNDSSSSMDSSSSGSYNGTYGDEEEVGMDYYYPEMDGSLDLVKRKKYYFNPSDGFSLTTTDTTTGVKPGDCSHAYCVHVVFESDYGAMSTFDAFYLDSYESVGGPIGTSSFTVGDHAPLVLGRFPKESIDRLGANWSQVFNWNDTRRTTWTFFPTRNSLQYNEIDLTLSLKQVYTALPNFYAQYADEMNMGPLYSSNLTDQVVIRINAHHENLYTSASGMLPIVVNHTGSQLVDINITSTRLYADARNDSNEIQLTVKIGRRKYGGLAPWIPVRGSPCFFPPTWFSACLEANAFSLRRATDDLLSYKTISNALDIRPIVKMCADSASQYYSNAPYPSGSGSWDSGGSQQANSPDSMDAGSWRGDGGSQAYPPASTYPPATTYPPGSTYPPASGSMNGDGGSQTYPPPPPPPLAPASWDGDAGTWTGASAYSRDPLLDLEEALRDTVHRYPRCALNDVTMKSDGQGVTLHHEPATTRIDFGEPSFSFYLVLEIDNQTMTTHVFTSDMSPQEIAQGIYSVLPAGREWLRLSVRYGNNTDEIEDVRRRNRWTMEAYEDALRWSGTWAPSRGSSSGDDGSAGWNGEGQYMGPASDDNSGNSDSGESGGPVAGSIRPKKPSLLGVPAEQFSVFINFENLVVVPRVLAVYSPQTSMSFSIDDGKLQLELSPLLQLDVEYAPPSPELDLEWRNEPLWKTQARRLLRKLALTPNSCNKCLPTFERCLLDEDCVFGVNSYFADAMAWDRWANQTSNSTNEIDISGVVWESRAFFPGKGFQKLQDLLLCWAKNTCLLNEPASPVFNDSTGKWEKASQDRTLLAFEPTQIDLTIQRERAFAIYANGKKHYWYSWYCDSKGLEQFLSRTVLRLEPSFVRSFAIQSNCYGWNYNSNQPSQYNLTWADGFVDPIQFDVKDGQWYQNNASSSVVRPWSLTVQLNTASLGDDVGDRSIPWPQLQSWLNIFKSVPIGLGLGSYNSSNATDWTEPSTTFPLPPPTSPSAVCPACADALLACVSDSACSTAARAWLAWVLPGPSINSTLDWDGFTRIRWLGDPFGSDSITDAYREPLVKLITCLSKYSCAVGYNRVSNDTDTMVPTTLRVHLTQKLVSTTSFSSLRIRYGDLAPVLLDWYQDPQPYLEQVKAVYDEDIIGDRGTSNEGYVFNFTGSIAALERLNISGYVPWGVIKPIYSIRFQSPSGAQPTWDYLLSWFGVDTTPSNDTQCAACTSKLEVCYEDGECWRQVRDYALPVLQRKQGWLNMWPEFVSDDHTRYRAEIGSLLVDYAQNYMSKTSWILFTDILRCLSASWCDVNTMDSAVEPPATAYVPSYIKIEPARMVVLLYPDTTLDLNGQQWSTQYTHSGSKSEFEDFLRRGFGNRSDLSISVVETAPDMNAGPGSSSYNVTFSDNFYERMPWIYVRGPGQKPMSDSRWYRDPYVNLYSVRVTIDSMNQWPQWNRLTNMLSVAPADNTTALTPDWLLYCEAAQTAKRDCFNDYWCKYQVTQPLVWTIKYALLRSKPAYNPYSGLFEVDLTAAAATQDTRIANIVEQAALCAAWNATMTSRPVFQRGSVQFVRPSVGPLIIRRYGSDYFEYDQGWEEYQARNSLAGYSFAVRYWNASDDEITYDLESVGSIGVSQTTLLAWQNDTTGERIEATPTQSRLIFQSQSFSMYEDALPWLKWMSS